MYICFGIYFTNFTMVSCFLLLLLFSRSHQLICCLTHPNTTTTIHPTPLTHTHTNTHACMCFTRSLQTSLYHNNICIQMPLKPPPITLNQLRPAAMTTPCTPNTCSHAQSSLLLAFNICNSKNYSVSPAPGASLSFTLLVA